MTDVSLKTLLEKELVIFSPSANFNYTLPDGRHSVYHFTDVKGVCSDIVAPCVSKPAAISGTLNVRLVGCQSLLEEVPGRLRTVHSLKSRGSLKLTPGRVYNIRDDKDHSSNCLVVYEYRLFRKFFIGEIMAVLKLDNITVGQTVWKPCSQKAWDQRFEITLDRVSILRWCSYHFVEDSKE